MYNSVRATHMFLISHTSSLGTSISFDLRITVADIERSDYGLSCCVCDVLQYLVTIHTQYEYVSLSRICLQSYEHSKQNSSAEKKLKMCPEYISALATDAVNIHLY